MAYVRYEDVPARVFNNRVVPALRKFYRADGTFDLFGLNNLQANCMHYLAEKNEAALYCSRPPAGLSTQYPLGTYTVTPTSNNSTFVTINLTHYDGTLYAGWSQNSFKLKLDNSVGLFLYKVYMQSYSDHNGGERTLKLYNSSGAVLKTLINQSYNGEVTWTAPVGDASQMPDWKDYSYIDGCVRSWDGSKYTGNSTHIQLYFIHRYTDAHPLHRFYR